VDCGTAFPLALFAAIAIKKGLSASTVQERVSAVTAFLTGKSGKRVAPNGNGTTTDFAVIYLFIYLFIFYFEHSIQLEFRRRLYGLRCTENICRGRNPAQVVDRTYEYNKYNLI